jgi:arylsulfatase A-like enzyme
VRQTLPEQPPQEQEQPRPERRGGGRNQFGLPITEQTIADRLKAAGYATGLVGKWHLGGAPPFHPTRRGFDEFFGFLGGAHSYFLVDNPPILRGTAPVEEKEYLTDALAREAVGFIDRHREEPFFLFLSFNAVHTPMHATKDRLEEFKSISDERRRTYAAMMSAMDDAIGAVVDKLRALELEENTLVFFLSDNGGPTMPGTAGNASINTPLRGSKRTTLEGGIRVPFIVKWPGRVPAGKVYDHAVIQLDIVPTALSAAGVEMPDDAELDGTNLLPYLQGENDQPPHDTLYWRFGRQMAIRQGDWKLVRYDPRVDGETGRATGPKLYHLAADIGESNDVIDEQPEKAEALQAAWDEWNEENVRPLWRDGRGRQRRNANRQPREPAAITPRE